MRTVDVIEVDARPGVLRFQLAGQLEHAGVWAVVTALRARLRLAGDLLLDLRHLSCSDGSVVLLFTDLAGELAGRGRLYLLFPQASVLRLIEAFGLEEELLNVKLISHPSLPTTSQALLQATTRVQGACPPVPPPAVSAPPATAPASTPPAPRTPVAAWMGRRRSLPLPARVAARPRRVHRLAL